MKHTAFVHAIYIAPSAGAPMQQLTQAELIAGTGIRGDRYAQGNGAFSKAAPPKTRHITLIAKSGIEAANQLLELNHYPQFSEAQTRRNIVISGVTPEVLNSLVGRVFFLGQLSLQGIELCAPCQRPAKLLNKVDFIKSFEGFGGIRAAILDSGILYPEDVLSTDSMESE